MSTPTLLQSNLKQVENFLNCLDFPLKDGRSSDFEVQVQNLQITEKYKKETENLNKNEKRSEEMTTLVSRILSEAGEGIPLTSLDKPVSFRQIKYEENNHFDIQHFEYLLKRLADEKHEIDKKEVEHLRQKEELETALVKLRNKESELDSQRSDFVKATILTAFAILCFAKALGLEKDARLKDRLVNIVKKPVHFFGLVATTLCLLGTAVKADQKERRYKKDSILPVLFGGAGCAAMTYAWVVFLENLSSRKRTFGFFSVLSAAISNYFLITAITKVWQKKPISEKIQTINNELIEIQQAYNMFKEARFSIKSGGYELPNLTRSEFVQKLAQVAKPELRKFSPDYLYDRLRPPAKNPQVSSAPELGEA